jgi:septal ring factor EnvC (AmiA/AmiB activator)
MNGSFLLASFLALTGTITYAASDIYQCVGANGVKSYSNVGANKGCKKVDLPAITTIPAPNVKKSVKAASTKNFPTVDDATQKNRDAERKEILSNELKEEQKKLADLQAEYKNGEPDRLGNERNYAKYQERVENLKQDIDRSQQNIEALQRELGGS